MKKIKNNIPKLLMLILFFSVFLISCEEETKIDDTPDRLFRPALLTAAVDGNEVTFTWVPIANASYSLEISRDSFLFSNELQIISLDSIDKYTVGDLWSQSRYSARIKAISKVSIVKDSEYKQITFLTGIENVFYTVAADDIGVNQILLKWDKTKNVSQIFVSTTGAADLIIPLSDSDKATGQKLIAGLKAKTNYAIKIYFGEMLRGTISVITKS